VLHCGGWSASAGRSDTTPAEPHPNSNTQHSKNNTANAVVQQNSCKLLKMDIWMPETCWVSKKKGKWNKWNQVGFLFFNYLPLFWLECCFLFLQFKKEDNLRSVKVGWGPNRITGVTVVLCQCDILAYIKVLVLLLRAECNSFPIAQQRDRSRVVFTLQDTVAYSNGAGVGPPKCCAVSVNFLYMSEKYLNSPPEFCFDMWLMVVTWTAISFLTIIHWLFL